MQRGGAPTHPSRPPADNDTAELRLALRAWFMLRRRRLPWRDDPSPYRVWVSEIMLQQTQVATVLPYFERFILALPDVAALARADLSDVLVLWSGLGYYRRARMLHAAARVVVGEHEGVVPQTLEGLASLPGVGRYTAGAIASIAYGIAAPALDGNVARVLSRLDAFAEPVDSGAGQRHLWARATALVAPDDPSTHNQALMELGALVCTPRSPDCPSCPWSRACRAHADRNPEAYPNKRPKAAPKAVQAVAGLLHEGLDGDAVLLARRPEDALLGGLWELPAIECTTRVRADASRKTTLTRAFLERLAMPIEVGDHLASVTHQFTHRSLSLDVYRVYSEPRAATRPVPRPSWYTDARWVSLARPDAVPLSTLTRKVLAAVTER